MRSMKISDFINEPWRDIGQDAMKRGTEICKRNELMNPDANMVMLIVWLMPIPPADDTLTFMSVMLPPNKTT